MAETLPAGPAARLRDSHPRVLCLVALAATCVLWLGLRIVYFNGYYTEDSPGYVTDALYLVTGQYHARADVNGLNVGTYFPVAVALAAFGKSEIALALWPLFSSLLGLLSLAATGGLLFGRRAGVLAALLYATYPGDVFFSTVVMPDAIQAGWLAFSVFLIAWAFAGRDARRDVKLVAAGVAFGVCHLVRGNGLLLLPTGIVAAAVLARVWKRDTVRGTVRAAALCVAGWLAVQLVEGGIYAWATGDVLHRFHVVNRHYGTLQSIARFGLNTDWRTIPFSIFPPLLWRRVGGWGLLNLDQAYHGFVFCVATIGLGLGGAIAVSRRRGSSDRATAGLIVAAFWFAWPLLYHQFGSQSLTHFVPIHRLSRHLVLYAPGAVFATAAGWAVIAEAVNRWRSRVLRGAVWAAAAVVLVLHLAYNVEGDQQAHEAYYRIKATYARIRDHLPPGVEHIVGDPGDLGFFSFWLNPIGEPRVRLSAFADYDSCERLPQGIVLTRSNPGWEGLSAPVIKETVKRLPCLVQPPPDWRLLYGGYPEKIFLVPRPPLR